MGDLHRQSRLLKPSLLITGWSVKYGETVGFRKGPIKAFSAVKKQCEGRKKKTVLL